MIWVFICAGVNTVSSFNETRLPVCGVVCVFTTSQLSDYQFKKQLSFSCQFSAICGVIHYGGSWSKAVANRCSETDKGHMLTHRSPARQEQHWCLETDKGHMLTYRSPARQEQHWHAEMDKGHVLTRRSQKTGAALTSTGRDSKARKKMTLKLRKPFSK